MFKSKTKLFILFFLMITLITSYCFASEPTVTSEAPGDNAKSVTEETLDTTEESSQEPTENSDATQSEVLYDDLYLINDTVTMDKLVDGNVYICAKTATITGQINGNLFVVAETVNLDGAYVANSIFICSSNTTFNGACNDLYFAGSSLNVSYDSYIARDSRIACDKLYFQGLNYRNMYLGANTIDFGSEDATAEIKGNLNYSSSTELSLPEGLVSGKVTYSPTEINENTSSVDVSSIASNIISTLVFSLVVYFAFRFFTPKFAENVSNFSKVGKFFTSGLVRINSISSYSNYFYYFINNNCWTWIICRTICSIWINDKYCIYCI